LLQHLYSLAFRSKADRMDIVFIYIGPINMAIIIEHYLWSLIIHLLWSGPSPLRKHVHSIAVLLFFLRGKSELYWLDEKLQSVWLLTQIPKLYRLIIFYPSSFACLISHTSFSALSAILLFLSANSVFSHDKSANSIFSYDRTCIASDCAENGKQMRLWLCEVDH
jgi:hypothetical protein